MLLATSTAQSDVSVSYSYIIQIHVQTMAYQNIFMNLSEALKIGMEPDTQSASVPHSAMYPMTHQSRVAFKAMFLITTPSYAFPSW